jgi:hypothetical protein
MVAMIGLLSLGGTILQIPQKRNPAHPFIPWRAIDPVERGQRDLNPFWRTPYDPYDPPYGAFPDLFRRERGETPLRFGIVPDAIAMGVGRGGEEDQSDIPILSGS